MIAPVSGVKPAAKSATKKINSDQRFVLWLASALLVAIVLVTWLAPTQMNNDPTPTTYNNGVAGVKAVYLLLGELGYKAERWENGLEGIDAEKATLILAEPVIGEGQMEGVKKDVKDFLDRGGRVLATGVTGAEVLPGLGTKRSTGMFTALCLTTPEGQGELAKVGALQMGDEGGWGDVSVGSRVEQRCGKDAVVVIMKVGKGEAVWWSSAMPMTNRGLKQDASLKLVLASVGEPGRRVLFDETFHGPVPTLWDTTKGLPMRAIALQTALVAVLLVLSFGRRNGPLLTPVRVVRSSPLEFAESMGHLYQKAGATGVATEGARRRLMRFLQERCGVPAYLLSGAPEAMVEAVQGRMGGEWRGMGEHLRQAGEAEHTSLAPKSALKLVKAMDEDLRRLMQRMKMSKGESD